MSKARRREESLAYRLLIHHKFCALDSTHDMSTIFSKKQIQLYDHFHSIQDNHIASIILPKVFVAVEFVF